MKKVISTCLFGNRAISYRKYALGSIRNARFVYDFMPDWKFRMYYDNTAPKDIISRLKLMQNTELIEMPTSKGREGCFWRFLAFDDADVTVCRDLDFPMQENDIFCINDWMKKDYMSECIWFAHDRLALYNKKEPRYYMAGCISSKKPPFSTSELINEYEGDKTIYGADEFFLTNHFVPKILKYTKKILIHSEPQPGYIPIGKTKEHIELFPETEDYIYLDNNWIEM
jgi:hypothetical protein